MEMLFSLCYKPQGPCLLKNVNFQVSVLLLSYDMYVVGVRRTQGDCVREANWGVRTVCQVQWEGAFLDILWCPVWYTHGLATCLMMLLLTVSKRCGQSPTGHIEYLVGAKLRGGLAGHCALTLFLHLSESRKGR